MARCAADIDNRLHVGQGIRRRNRGHLLTVQVDHHLAKDGHRVRMSRRVSLSDVQSVVDVGGASGHLLAALLDANPGLQGTVFERPPVAETAVQWLHAAGLTHRCDVLEGDFFESVPSGGDVYVLSHVIHDWDDAQCLRLLANCRRAMASHGRLVIVETVLPEANEPSPSRLMDLIMLVNAPSGQERTLDEYRDLLARADFRVSRVIPTASPVSVIEAIPA